MEYKFTGKKKRVIGWDSIAKYGYKYIQNNQLTTILAALEATSNGKHFFAKQGTGQGKSLTLAILALNYAKMGKRVMIFSCYDHLAKRDHAAFQQMYTDNRITSAYIEEANAEQLDAKVMYANLETFIRLYYSNTEKLAKGDEDGLRNFPIFGIDVILLDEFDALILDSDRICIRVYDMSSLYSLGNFASAKAAKGSFKRKLSEVEGMRNFMIQGWTSQLMNTWTGGFSSEEEREATNYLGNRVRYVGGEWWELSKGNFYLYCSKIHVLSYLLSASTLVGLSGSINEVSMKAIRQALTSIDSKKEIQYLTIPNFYGIGESRNVAKTIQKNLSRSKWNTEILRDLDSNSKDRPVLVFGNVNNPGQWNSLKSLLQTFAQQNNRRFQIIDKEEQTTDIAMMHACEADYITLATHIVGRGADFKIHPEIDAKGGLHVLITGIPKNDPRLYTQMIGRTARMTNQGSHSVILQEALPPEDIQPIKISSFHKKMNEVMSQVQGYLTSLPYSKENWQRWLLILNALLKIENWPVPGSTDSIALEIASHVVDEQVNSALLQKFKIKRPQQTGANRNRTRSNEQRCIIM
eukprot:gene16034-18095_t